MQYEARIPIYSFGKKLWRNVQPSYYFENVGVGAIWDIVLTQPIPIDVIEISAVEHPSCIPGKCQGTTRVKNRRALKEIAENEFTYFIQNNSEYARFLKRFPIAKGLTVQLPSLDDE